MEIGVQAITTMENYDVTTRETMNDVIRNMTSAGGKEAAEVYPEAAAIEFFRRYPPPVLFIIAGFGNILSFVVFSQEALRQSVTSIYLRVLAVVDTIYVWLGTSVMFLGYTLGIPNIAKWDWTCKSHSMLWGLSRDLSAWVLVLVAGERFIGVHFPHLAKSLVTRRRAWVSVATAFAILALKNSFFAISVIAGVVKDSHGNIINRLCFLRGNPEVKYFATYIWPWLDFFIYIGFPFILMITINVSIIVRLFIGRSIQSTVTSSVRRISNMTAILLTVSFGFVILTAPYGAYFIAVRSTPYKIGRTYSKLTLLSVVGFFGSYLNHSINFLFYCLSGRKFRDELRRMFACQVKRDAYSSAGSNTIDTTVSISIVKDTKM